MVNSLKACRPAGCDHSSPAAWTGTSGTGIPGPRPTSPRRAAGRWASPGNTSST